MSGVSRLLHWQGLDPSRVEGAAVRLTGDTLEAHGTSVTAGYTLTYLLQTGARWITEELFVRVDRLPARWRALRLTRDRAGEWRAEWSGEDDGALPDALPDLRGALDCDLGLCPLTNTMPILRHDLVGAAQRGETTPHELVMAWISVPDLAVHRSLQTYAASDRVHDAGKGALVTYASEGFRTTLEVDGDGLVVSYPGLAQRQRAP